MNAPMPVLALFGGQEWVLILLLGILLFGASRLPGIARSFGRSVGEFKQGLKDEPDPQKNGGSSSEAPANKN